MKKKILFGITSLTIGGAERVLVDLVNKISQDYDITIFTIYDGGELKKELVSNAKIVSMYNKPYNEYGKLDRLKISLKLLLKNKTPEGYDTQVAFLEGPITRLFSKKSKARKIAWVHTDLSKFFSKGFKDKIKSKLDKKIYKNYDKIVFVSEDIKNKFNQKYGNDFNETVIRNYLDYENIIKKADENISLPYHKNDINIVSASRLVEQKGIDRFIKVHSMLEKDGIHSKVYIVGDGPLRYTLQKQIDSLGETENFFLLGEKTNPYPYIKNADYFCLLSYYEGYGMVIEEAKILNKNIIITDIPAKECLKDYNKGVILENTENGIYKGLKKILSSEEMKNDIDKEEKFNSKNYEEIIDQVKSIL